MIPYERIADYFIHEASIPISVGSLFNFNKEAYHLLETFDGLAKEKLIAGKVMCALSPTLLEKVIARKIS